MPDQKPSSAPKKKPAAKTVGKPLADIAKPNKGSLDTGSRPIIVSRKPVVDDPMVNKTANDSTAAPIVEDTRPMKDLLKAGRKELILNPTDQDASQDETAKPKPGETINAGGDEAAEAQKTKTAESVNFEDLPVDESEEEEKSYVDALADEDTNNETEGSTNDDAEADKTKDLPSENEVAEAEADDAPEITETKPTKKPAPKKVIAPVVPEATESDPAEAEATESEDTADDTKETKRSDKSKKPEEEKEQTQDEFTGDSVVQEPEGGLVDELAKQTADKKEQQVQDKKMDAQQEKIEELTAAKTYYVKTSKLSKRRARNAIIIVLLLLVIAVVAANFALDAELFDASIKPLTNIL